MVHIATTVRVASEVDEKGLPQKAIAATEIATIDKITDSDFISPKFR